jgi:apolipoprotein N-acyltransferase
VALLSAAVDGRRARTGGWLGFVYGAAFFVPLLHWTGVYVGAAPWLLLAGGEAAFTAALGAALTRLQALPAAPFWIGCAWVGQEALRARFPFNGFPWGRLAFSQADSPLRWFIRLGGSPLLSFVVAVLGAALWWAGRHVLAHGVHRRTAVTAAVVACLVPLAWPASSSLSSAYAPSSGAHGIVVAAIQGSVPDRGLEFEDRARQVLDNHIAETLRLASDVQAGRAPRPDLVIWPEDSSDVDPFEDAQAFADITNTVQRIGVPVLVGAILDGPGNHRRNAGILWSPTTGPGAEYVKRHPVPFGEYIPLRSIARLVSSDADLVSQDMVAGHGNGLVTGGAVPLGDVICFEVAFDSLVQSSVRAGAQLVVVQTNNATFGHTAETYQQLAIDRLRAVETDRTVIQAATTGKSAIIEPNGRVVAESGALFTPAVLDATVYPRTGTTLAVRLGALPEWFLAGCALAGILYGMWPALRRRVGRRPQPAPAEVEEMVST